MTNGMSLVVVVVLGLFIVVGGGVFYLLDKVEPNAQVDTHENSDYLRQIAITSLASSLNHYMRQAHVGGIGEEWQQLGTAQDSCAESTAHCQLEIQNCLDLHSYVNKAVTLPIDPLATGPERTGYAIRAVSDTMIEIIACHTESDQPIIQRVTIKSD